MFAEQLHTKFRVVYEPSKTTDVELVEAVELRCTARQEQFSLVFRGPHEPFLGQRLFPIEHEQLGAFDLFLVPVGKDDGGLYYEALFNRLRERARE
jgi:hypothetical protein